MFNFPEEKGLFLFVTYKHVLFQVVRTVGFLSFFFLCLQLDVVNINM